MSLTYGRAPIEPRIRLGMSPLITSPEQTALIPVKTTSTLANEVYALLPRASEKIARICAEMLTSAGHMTQSLAFAFIARGDRSSLIALAGAQTLPTTLLLHRASAGTAEEARAVASRAYLDPLLLAALCDRHDPVLDHLIAENPALIDAARVVDQLLLRAKKDPKLAAHLLKRDDLSFHQRAKLFETASATQRALLVKEAIEEAGLATSHERPRPALPVSLTNAIERGDRDDVLSALAASCGMSSMTASSRPRLDQSDGAIAALAGLALGMEKKSIDHLLDLIGVDPVMKLRPGGAVDLMEQLNQPSAKLLLDAMNAPYLSKRTNAGQNAPSLSHPTEPFIMNAVA